MEKTIKTMLALMAGALTFSACSSDEDFAGNENENNGAKLVTLTAYQEGDGTTSRAAIGTTTSGSTTINWTTGDKINYFGNGTGEYMTLSSGAGTATGTFTGTVTTGTTDYVLYPYQESATCASGVITAEVPMTQYAEEDSFDPKAALMVATVTSGTVQFKNVMSFVKVTVPEGMTQCKQITIKAKDAWTTVAGKVNITVSDAEWAETDKKEGQAFVRLVPKTGTDYLGAGKSYYIAILPQAMATGFELIFNDDDVIKVKQSASSSVTFTRSKTKKLATFTDFTYTVSTIDLTNVTGTSLKMADRNIGAAGTSDYGDYFAWGALRPMYTTHTAGSSLSNDQLYKTGGFSWKNAPYYTGDGGSNHSWSKYTSEGSTLDASDDIAAMLWGGNWRMPTNAEWEANKSNSSVIGLPLAGNYYGTSIDDDYVDEFGFYWSSTVDDTDYGFSLKTDGYNAYNDDYEDRKYGQSVRPVLAR